jgi:uncharacterized protein YcfJ
MKQAVAFSAMGVVLASFGTTAGAEEVGRVISSTPVIQQVAVPRQICNTQPVAVQQPNSGGGAVIGAIVGGLLGNTIGHGMGRAAATGLGVVAGAAVGDNVEGQGRNYPQAVQQCSTQTSYENRTVGYNVQYEYAGKQYNVQLPYDPGQTIRLQLTPVGGTSTPPDTAGAPSGPGPAQPVIVAPPVAQTVMPMVAAPAPVAYPVAYPAYYYGGPSYYRPYYAPISLSLGFGYWGGHRHHGHHHHGHWR